MKTVHLTGVQQSIIRPHIEAIIKARQEIGSIVAFAFGPKAEVDLDTMTVKIPEDSDDSSN